MQLYLVRIGLPVLLQVWIVYHSKMKTKQVYLQDSTYATPFSLMLWGARVRHERPLGKKHAVEVVIGERKGKHINST